MICILWIDESARIYYINLCFVTSVLQDVGESGLTHCLKIGHIVQVLVKLSKGQGHIIQSFGNTVSA